MIALYVTFPNKSCAEEISCKLLEQKLIACANIHASESFYLWMGVIENSSEFVAIYKAQKKFYPLIEKFILAEHPYETPCIIYWEVESNELYKEWVIRESTHGALNIE